MTESTSVLTGDEKVAKVLKDHPHLLDTFIEYGFKNITNPVMRRTVAHQVSLQMACEMKDVELQQFLDALNSKIE